MTNKNILVASIKTGGVKAASMKNALIFLLFASLLSIWKVFLLAIPSRDSSQRTLPRQHPVSSTLTMRHSPVGIQFPKVPSSEGVARLNISIVCKTVQLAQSTRNRDIIEYHIIYTV